MIAGLQVNFLWNDYDVIEISINASNGEFAGKTKAYASRGGLAEAASILEGFPRQISDTREVELGSFEPNSAGGGISMKLSCRDGAGHAALDLRIASEGPSASWWNCPVQSVHLFAKVEAAAIDDFMTELRRLDADQAGSTFLRFTK
jgi:hypothetical protein